MKIKKHHKEKIHRLELLGAVCLTIVLVGIVSIKYIDFTKTSGFSLPLVTGFVSSELVTQTIDLQIDQSQTYKLTSKKNSFILTSLRLGGIIEGEGFVQIYLDDNNGNKLLIYSNIQEKQKKRNLITGYFAANISIEPNEIISTPEIEINKDQSFYNGQFYSECVETCFTNISFSSDTANQLIFYIGDNVKLKINQIAYTIE